MSDLQLTVARWNCQRPDRSSSSSQHQQLHCRSVFAQPTLLPPFSRKIFQHIARRHAIQSLQGDVDAYECPDRDELSEIKNDKG
jgi:hypothetical protein